MNSHIVRLLEVAGDRFSIDRSSMSYAEWIRVNTTLRGREFSWRGYEFQEAIMNDMHPEMDVVKCSQIGLTEIQIRKMLAFLVRNRSTTGMMTFPDEKTFKKNSTTRIKPILDTDKVFNGESDRHATRSVSLYQMGKSFLHVVMCTESDATSTSADVVFSDEVDLSDQHFLTLFSSRVQNSAFKIKQRFSTPTFPSFGIDLGFQASDQHHYLVRCQSCNHYQHPDFNRTFVEIPGLPDHVDDLLEIDESVVDAIDIPGSYVKCERCERPLDLGNPELREWVAKYPSRRHHRGRCITPFATDRLNPAYIIGQLLFYKKNQYVRGFVNTVLGKTYSDGNIRLDEADINACFTNHATVPAVDKRTPCWVGIDMGQTVHLVVIEGSRVENAHAFLFETFPVERLAERIKDLTEAYNVIGGCIDRLPFTPTSNEIRDMTNRVILPAQYTLTKDVNLVYDEFEDLDHAQVNRTAALDTVQRSIKKRYLRMSGYGHNKLVVTEHLRDMVRDEKPEKQAVWVKLTGNDHFFHAIGYALLAMKVKELERFEKKGEERAMVLIATPNVQEVPGKILDLPGKPYKNPLLQTLAR